MYRLRVDKGKKILFVDLEESVTNEESLEAAKDFWTKMASLGRGSVIICDITKFKNGSKVSRILLQKVMKLIESYEPKAVIRVLDGYSGAMIFDRAYRNIKANYKVVRVDSKEKAMEYLETLNQIPPVFKTPPSHN
jgi:KaiC/GvpD/RAD55 family RecA-like ATPase